MIFLGPCKQNEILVLPKSKRIPICEASRCEIGLVRYNNVCSKLESPTACQLKSHTLHINPTNLQLYCALLTPSRVTTDDEEVYEGNDCFLGGKRSQDGSCPNL